MLAAINRGLRTIIFLEHLEAEINYAERTWLTESDFAVYFEEGQRLREKYAGRISVRLGVEVGHNPRAVNILQHKLSLYPWDQIGLSYHFFFLGGRHLNMVSRRQDNIDALAAAGPDRVVTEYFSGLIQALQAFDNITVLCHLDAVMRHYPGLCFNRAHMDQIDRLLDLVRRKNVRLEINTSGYALRNEPFPARPILRRAVQLGIPLVAGSDAHRPEQVARYFDLLPVFLSGLGKQIDPHAPDDIESPA